MADTAASRNEAPKRHERAPEPHAPGHRDPDRGAFDESALHDRTRDGRAPEPREPSGDAEPLWRDALGECLRDLRHDRGEKLTDTASRAGISPQYLSEIERGMKDPSSEMIAAVAGALELTLTDLTVAVAERLRAVQFTASVAAYVHRSAYALAA